MYTPKDKADVRHFEILVYGGEFKPGREEVDNSVVWEPLESAEGVIGPPNHRIWHPSSSPMCPARKHRPGDASGILLLQ